MSRTQPDLFECERCHGITKEGVIVCGLCARTLEKEVGAGYPW